MRNWMKLLLVVAVGLPVVGRAQEEGRELKSKIREVTVYSDRAQVTREAVVELSSEERGYSFSKLPGWVDDGSVRLALVPAEAGRIVDVRVQRDYLARSTDEQYVKAAEAVQEIADQIASLQDELVILDGQVKQIEAIKLYSLDKLPKEAAMREVKVESYGQVVKFIADSLRETAKARRAVELKRRELTPELQVRQRRLQELQQLTQLEETNIHVVLEGKGKARLELTYMLPGATWEPAHELRASAARPDVAELTSLAVVSQTTGEAWEGVALAFSTQSATESNRIPQLTALTLGDSSTAARIIDERTQSFNRALNAFQVQNRAWNEVAQQAGPRMELYDNNYDQMQEVQSRASAMFERIKTRGTTAHFAAQGPQTVRADGSPVRVRIGRSELAGKGNIVAAPELSLNAVRTLKMTNTGEQAVLPGSTSLYQDGAFLGMTELDFVADGEEFAVFMGVADQVKLSRTLDRKLSSIDRKKRTKMKAVFVVTVENLSKQPVTLDLMDRIPVSQNKEIEVDEVEITGDKRPDSKGLLQWTLTLQPREKKVLRIQYRVEYPPELVREMHRERQMKRSAMPAAKSYDFEDDDISGQLMQAEELF